MTQKEEPLPFKYSLFAGAIAGVSEILTMYPLDVVKTRFQIQVGNSASIVSTFKQMIKTEGVGSLYRGILPPIMVEAPKRAIKFGANDQYSKLYAEQFGWKAGILTSMATGTSAGITEAIIVSGPDLVKIRMQDKRNAGLYNGAGDVVKHILKTEGYYGLGRGKLGFVDRYGLTHMISIF
jgi:solute carrier family 25 2-oxodicarboxylate transporter 21